MLKVVVEATKIPFDFKKWIYRIVSIVPHNDISGILTLKLVEQFSDKRCSREAYGCYLPDNTGKACHIELNISNILSKGVPMYLFEDYHEIAALYLSHYVYHEVGHHVHYFKRHGVAKEKHELFATRYDVYCYFQYYKLRRFRILLSFLHASYNFISFTKNDRIKIKKELKEYFLWPYKNRNIPLP